MKLQVILSALAFAAVSAASYAADTDAKPMKPHSHMQEKTGVAPAMPATPASPAAAPAERQADQAAPAKAEGKKASKDRKKHYHPRDMK